MIGIKIRTGNTENLKVLTRAADLSKWSGSNEWVTSKVSTWLILGTSWHILGIYLEHDADAVTDQSGWSGSNEWLTSK